MAQAHNLLKIWDLYASQVLNEKAAVKKLTKKPGPGPVDINSKQAQGIANADSTGPNAAKTLQTPIDVKTLSPKDKLKNPYNINKFSLQDEQFDQKMQKTAKAVINNNMKSIFDKLFEEVVNSDDSADLDALGVGQDDDGMGETDEGLGGDDVTVTLTSDQVECLKAILAQLEGDGEGETFGGEPDGDEGVEVDSGESPFGEEDAEEEADAEEDAEEEDDDMKKVKKEGTEMKEVPDSAGKSLQGKNNKVSGKATSLAKGGKADGKVTQTVDGKGKDLPDSAGMGMTKPGHKVVKGKIKGGNQEFFGS